jgi:hypothetical protein
MLGLGSGDRVLSIGAALLVLMGAGGAAGDGANGYAGVSDRRTTDWTGLYIGGQLGGTWSDVDWTQTNANYFNTLGPAVVGSDSGFSPSGAIGGIVGGYNYQAGHWASSPRRRAICPRRAPAPSSRPSTRSAPR